MRTDTWCVERLETSDKEYRALKNAGLNTFGDVAALPSDKLAAKAKMSRTAAEKLLNQIARITREEEDDAAAQPDAEPPAALPEPPAAPQNEEKQEARPQPRTVPTSLDELRDYPKETITPEIAADILGCDPQNIRSQAQVDAGALGFPVIIMGSRIKIPRRGFIYFMEYGKATVQRKS